jgi:hypothetical protein
MTLLGTVALQYVFRMRRVSTMVGNSFVVDVVTFAQGLSVFLNNTPLSGVFHCRPNFYGNSFVIRRGDLKVGIGVEFGVDVRLR